MTESGSLKAFAGFLEPITVSRAPGVPCPPTEDVWGESR